MNEILLDKIGKTKTDNLIQDCYKIYRESFDKQFPDYFDKNHLKGISFVTSHEKDSNEIVGIGMSCPDDLLTKQFAQVFGGLIGGSDGANPDDVKNTGGGGNIGHTHGGSGFDGIGTSNFFGRGLTIALGNGSDAITKTAFVATNLFRSLVSNFGTFNSGLGQVLWTASNTVLADDIIKQTSVTGRWNRQDQAITEFYLLLWDNINPNVPVLLGETVNVEYKLVFS